MKTTVQKSWLIEKLQANRATHRDLFLKALEGFKKVTIRRFEDNIEKVKRGKWPEVYFHIALPRDMTSEYDRAIEMLANHIGNSIDLSKEDYTQLVQDDWQWKQEVTTTNSTYATGSAPAEE